MKQWNVGQSLNTYGLPYWGDGYFAINEQGHLAVMPRRRQGPSLDLYAIAREAQSAGLSLPVLLRFTDILHDRVQRLHAAFDAACEQHDYAGTYTAVYPIKVNQQRTVVEEILAAAPGRVGLEAGSKPELMAVLALANADGGVIVCNGYKDREYIRLALIGRALGHRIFIVVEKLSELDIILQEAEQLGVDPLLGVRVRLASLGAGKWQNTGGEKAKFGLSAGQVLQLLQQLRAHGRLDALRLMHFHMGSQIANIHDIQHGLGEAGRYYAELRRLGAPIEVVDVGGGLGVDYEGSRSRSFCSMNYSLEEYAANIVRSLAEVCAEHQLPQPALVTEAGRAMTAHHAVLVTNVTEAEAVETGGVPQQPDEEAPTLLHDLWQLHQQQAERPASEVYHDAVHWLQEAQVLFAHGAARLEDRANAERLYAAICRSLQQRLQNENGRRNREILDELNEKLADKYFCNFSIFQSVPDVWGIDQVFPIVPLHRLEEAPTRRGCLQDLTCDSDGRIDHYVDEAGIENSLPLHSLREGEPYLLGLFMVGAYQEILGDLHNLFGDTHAVNVALDECSGHVLRDAENGDRVDELLNYVHFSDAALVDAYRRKVAAAELPADTRARYLRELEAGLRGYTYLED